MWHQDTPITPQAHLEDTSGCQAAVCDLYMADEGRIGGVRLSLPTWIRETGAREKNNNKKWLIIVAVAQRHVNPTLNEVYFNHPIILEFK